ncbi:MAG: hypothetical protein DDT26_01045 [Dehalococcoidia bacterium]|nr:hypothetical protein [Chloroflexota bacterium]
MSEQRIDSRIDPANNNLYSNYYRVRAYHPETHTVDLESANLQSRAHLLDVPIAMGCGGSWEYQVRSQVVDTVDVERWGKVDRGPRWGELDWPQVGDLVAVVFTGADQSVPLVVGYVQVRGDRHVNWALRQIYRPRKNRYTQALATDLNTPVAGRVYPQGVALVIGEQGSLVLATRPTHNAVAFLSFDQATGWLSLWSRDPRQEDAYHTRLDFDPIEKKIRLRCGASEILMDDERIEFHARTVRTISEEAVIRLDANFESHLRDIPYDTEGERLAQAVAQVLGENLLRGNPEGVEVLTNALSEGVPPALAQRMDKAIQAIIPVNPNNLRDSLTQHLGTIARLNPSALSEGLAPYVESLNIPGAIEALNRRVMGEFEIGDAIATHLQSIQALPDSLKYVLNQAGAEVIAQIPALLELPNLSELSSIASQFERIAAAADDVAIPEALRNLPTRAPEIFGELGEIASEQVATIQALPQAVFNELAALPREAMGRVTGGMADIESGVFRWLLPQIIKTNRPITAAINTANALTMADLTGASAAIQSPPSMQQTKGYHGALSQWLD